MRRAALVTASFLSLVSAAADLSLISAGLFGPGDGDSAYRSDPFSFSYSTAPVANDGTVFFISQATNLDIDASFETGADWDLFTRALGSDPIAVSLRIDASPGTREGQATSVAFANNLVASIRDNSLVAPTHQHLILRSTANLNTASDIATGSTEFLHPRFSRNGNFLIFASDDNGSDAGDNNQRRDIFVQSLSPLSLTRLSIRNEIGIGHVPRDALFPDISDDGNHIVFESADLGFVSGDSTEDAYDIFYHNRQTGATMRVNSRLFDPLDNRGLETAPCSQPTIDGGATTILFSSADPAIVLGDGNDSSDIFAFDIASRSTKRISAIDGKAEGSSEQAQINQSGRFIIFRSNATNFPNANGAFQIYLFDAASDSMETISLNTAGAPANADCTAPAISPDGRYISFSSSASNLIGVSNGFRQLYLADRGPTFLNIRPEAFPVDTYCSTNGSSPLDLSGEDAESAENSLRFRLQNLPAASQGSIRLISGALVNTIDTYTRADFPIIFIPAQGYIGSSILHYEVIDETGAVSQAAPITIFVNDFSNGLFELVSVGDRSLVTTAGQRRAMRNSSPADVPAFVLDSISMSADGRFATFATSANNLTAENQHGIFLRDTIERRTRLIEVMQTDASVHRPTISASGNAVVHMQLGQVSTLFHTSLDGVGKPFSRSTLSIPSSEQDVYFLMTIGISEDGGSILFATPTALDVADTDSALDIYMWQPVFDSITLVSTGANALPCSHPAISADGSWAAFVSRGSHDPEVVESENQVLWMINLHNGQVKHITEIGVDLSFPSLSRSGRYLAVQSGPNAIILDRDTSTRTDVGSANQVAISANGRFLYFTDDQARRLDWRANTERIISAAGATEADVPVTAGAISGNGSIAIFASTASNLTDDPDARSDIFRINLGPIANFAPTATDASESIDEDSSTPIALLVADPEGDDMLIEIVAPPSHGSLSAIASGNLTYTPDQDYAGTDSFTWRAHDSSAFSPIATVNITISNLNDPPVLAVIADHDATEGQLLEIAVSATDPDTANATPDVLTLTADHGSIEGNTFRLTPPHDVATRNSSPEPLVVTLRLEDNAGASVSQTFTLSVSDVNVPPTADNPSLLPALPRTTEDLVLSYNYSDFDSDPEGATSITWHKRDTAKDGFQEVAFDVNSIPAASTRSGQEWFAEIVPRDDRGAAGPRVTLPVITITNSLPEATAQSLSLNEDSSLVITLSASDDDPDDILSITPSSPANGILSAVARASSSQTLRYTPAPNFFGTDSLSYTVSDGVDSASATITLIVLPLNDPPVLTVQASFIAESANSATLSIVITDVDEPSGISPANYRLTFSAPNTGDLRTSQGAIISAPVTADSLPISFEPDGGLSDETLTVFATDGSNLDSRTQELRIAAGVRFQNLSLVVGWNLVALTRDPLTFPFDNAFAWDAADESLFATDGAAAGQAFWTHSTRNTRLAIPGMPGGSSQVSVLAGWNLIGGTGNGDSVGIPFSADIAWRWSGHFSKAVSLSAGEGAWIHFPESDSFLFELISSD